MELAPHGAVKPGGEASDDQDRASFARDCRLSPLWHNRTRRVVCFVCILVGVPRSPPDDRQLLASRVDDELIASPTRGGGFVRSRVIRLPEVDADLELSKRVFGHPPEARVEDLGAVDDGNGLGRLAIEVLVRVENLLGADWRSSMRIVDGGPSATALNRRDELKPAQIWSH
jgi:hypothetical protein